MPGYGKQTAAAGRSLWRASADMSRVFVSYQSGSLLACNFNALWVTALNLVRSGTPVDYFAMLHDDIGAEDGWLDALIQQLEEHRLDVLGVAVPIKNHKGLTSLAVAHESGDPWRIKQRLTLHEVLQLPEVITDSDVGGQLLINTGCWVCRFDPSWVSNVYFTINDRICFDTKQQRYVHQVEPEDWFFSRLLHEQGLKVGATRKVRVVHEGPTTWNNYQDWGSQSYDQTYATQSIIQKTETVSV